MKWLPFRRCLAHRRSVHFAVFVTSLYLLGRTVLYLAGQTTNAYPQHCRPYYRRASADSSQARHGFERVEVLEPVVSNTASFIDDYSSRCNCSLWFRQKLTEKAHELYCPCVPSVIERRIHINLTMRPQEELVRVQDDVRKGGQWSPGHCKARERLAVIIPLMNRTDHLQIFVPHIIPALKKQLLSFKIFVIEQHSPDLFNKAAIMNAGVLEILKTGEYDCFIFHDVDLLLENGYNFYSCQEFPVHLGSYVNTMQYKLKYPWMFGGVVALTKDQFFKVNGFSNMFYGWGGEDDNMAKRIQAKGMPIIRYPSYISRYTMIHHERDRTNRQPNREKMLSRLNGGAGLDNDGLNTAKYTVIERRTESLYTWIYVAVPTPS